MKVKWKQNCKNKTRSLGQAPLFHKKPPTLEEIRVRFMLLCITKSCHHWIAIESCYYTQGIHPNIFSYWLADLCISFKKALQWKAYSLLISCLSSCLLFPIFGLGLINQLKTVKPDEDLCNRGSQFWNGLYTVLVSRFWRHKLFWNTHIGTFNSKILYFSRILATQYILFNFLFYFLAQNEKFYSVAVKIFIEMAQK